MSRSFVPIRQVYSAIAPTLLRVQTDGSFTPALSRTAVLFYREPKPVGYLGVYDDGQHCDSTEAEWESVCCGLRYAVRFGDLALHLENDNQGVIRTLQMGARPKKQRYAWQFDEAMDLTKEFEHLSVRWIPREQNMADRLFRRAK